MNFRLPCASGIRNNDPIVRAVEDPAHIKIARKLQLKPLFLIKLPDALVLI